jgi:ABC-type lipoprotein export system ATPase subunit
VLVTHDDRLAAHAQREITLADGRICADVPGASGPRPVSAHQVSP